VVGNIREFFIVERGVRSRFVVAVVVDDDFEFCPKRRRGCFNTLADVNVSLEVDEGVLSSGLIIHHDDLPVPSLCIRLNRLCNDKL
jgi:hypothetical protein